MSEIRLVGRFDPMPAAGPDAAAAGAVRFAWSGSSFEVRFTGPSAAMRLRVPRLEPHTVRIDGKPVTLDEKTTAYWVKVDDRPPVTLEVTHEQERYELAAGLDPNAVHEVRVMREAEAFAGVHELLGIELGPGGKRLPARARNVRIEVVGDSISCGYGVLGGREPCPFTYATERVSAAYGARIGRALDADVSTVCWSGRGVLRNYDGSTTGVMPELFETTLPSAPQARWKFETPPPHAVIVNLGTNDFFGGGGEPLDLVAFEDKYVAFVKHVRELYPQTWILVTTSPMLREEPLKSVARGRLEHVVERRTSAGDKRIELVVVDSDAPHWGCDGHPDEELNGRVAARLEAVLRARLGLPSAP